MSRPKMTVALPFAVFPPVGGGQQRTFWLYRHLARDFDVELVTLAENDLPFSSREIAPRMREIRVPKSARHQAEDARLMQEVGGVPVGDVGIPRFLTHTPDYARHLARSIETAAVVVACHPYCLPVMRGLLGDRPLVYDAHDVEYLLKRTVLGPSGATGAGLAESVRELEAEACRASRLVLCCAPSDADALGRLYGVAPERLVVVPNGVDTEALRFTPPAARENLKAQFGIAGQPIAIFVGSWHPPNLAAAEKLFEIAAAAPDVTFLVVGSQCVPLAERPRPANVGLMGVVDDETLAVVLALADVALNPMLDGSGSNVKLATYLAAGVPVITTPFGARGYALAHGDSALICPVADFPDAMTALLADRARAEGLALRGRRMVEEQHDWKALAERALTALHRLRHESAAGAGGLDALIQRASVALVDLGMADDQPLLERVAAALDDVAGGPSPPR